MVKGAVVQSSKHASYNPPQVALYQATWIALEKGTQNTVDSATGAIKSPCLICSGLCHGLASRRLDNASRVFPRTMLSSSNCYLLAVLCCEQRPYTKKTFPRHGAHLEDLRDRISALITFKHI